MSKKNHQNRNTPPHAVFLGPKSENENFWESMLNSVFLDYVNWRKNYFPSDPFALKNDEIPVNRAWFDGFETELQSMLGKLKDNFPFYSPRYIGHMLSELAMPAVIGYFTGMLYNPNNVTHEAAPVTVNLELEFGEMICKMLGYGNNSWAHICSGGTVANIEALWVAREVQFLPLVIREFCDKCKTAGVDVLFEFEPENRKKGELNTKALISLSPSWIISERDRFLKCIQSLEGKRAC